MTASWRVEVQASAGAFRLDAAFTATARVVGLFGPSGAGKSTLVECLAGVHPAAGLIEVGGERWLAPGLCVPPPRRRAGWVPQDGALFPHLTVAENLDFAGRAGGALRSRSIEVLALAPLLGRRPAELSGGERMRAALARALCAAPRVLLLDEPLSGVDLPRRARVFRHLLEVRDGFDLPMLYVSHDPAEVQAVAEHVVLLEAGRVVATGPPAALLADAAALRLLDRLGFENVFRVAAAQEPAAADTGGVCAVTTPAGRTIHAPPPPEALRGGGWLAIRAVDVLLAAEEPRRLSARNVLPGSIRALQPSSDHILVRVDAGDEWVATLTPRAVADLALAPGRPAWVVAKTHSLHWLAE